jgi:hypothetical protein
MIYGEGGISRTKSKRRISPFADRMHPLRHHRMRQWSGDR